MASCCRRYRARRLKALDDDPKLLVIRPAAPATSLDHFKPFKLSTALMAVHKDCYAPIGLIQQGGPRRRETFKMKLLGFAKVAIATLALLPLRFNEALAGTFTASSLGDIFSGTFSLNSSVPFDPLYSNSAQTVFYHQRPCHSEPSPLK